MLALFTLLAMSSGLYFLAKRIKFPYTILLVLVGLAIVPLAGIPFLEPYIGFIDDLVLTPELLFFIFLPILIFESAFNMNIRKIVENSWSIGLLSIVGLLISAAAIALGLYLVLPLVGIEIPFIVALLFGAIISATDPVAVLSLFKTYGAPKRLSLIFEGESLFNDGTAVALFMAILAIAESGVLDATSILSGVGTFASMLIGGIILGLVMAGLFYQAIRGAKSNEFVAVTLLIISAHLVFVTGEAINHFQLLGPYIHVSSIIATTVAALFLGNYARHALSPRTDEYLSKSIEHLAFIANSLVFVLAGVLFATLDVDFSELWVPILITVLIVAVSRVISVYAVAVPIHALKLESIPATWRRLLAWGSLRGALAIIIVLLVPEDFTVPGWALEYSVRDFLLALAIGCVLATLFIKGLTIAPLIRRYKLDVPAVIDQVHYADLGMYYLLTEQSRFAMHKTRGFVRDAEYAELKQTLQDKFNKAIEDRTMLLEQHGPKVFEQSLHLTAIDVERHYLEELYVNSEVDEAVYRRISGKLNLQREKIEAAQHETINPSDSYDRKDVFDKLMRFIQRPIIGKYPEPTPIEKLQYYRAQMIIARKALKTLNEMQSAFDKPVFIPTVFEKISGQYERFRSQSAEKMDAVLKKYPDDLAGYFSELAEKSIAASGVRAVDYLRDKGIASEASGHDIQKQFK
jgi:CPA1 family monovalent cation:H+ antiporter